MNIFNKILSMFRFDSAYLGNAGPNMKQVGFVVGTGRCGSTILSQSLNAHSKICVPHELQIICSIGNGDRFYEKFKAGEFGKYTADDFIQLVEKCCPYFFEIFFDYVGYFNRLKYPQVDLGKILDGLFASICSAYQKEVFLEQTPWYGQRLDVLEEIFPEMKVIHIVRDGRDVAISYARTPWWSNDVMQNLLQWEREVTVIHQYGLTNRDNYHVVRYEDLMSNPEAELNKILKKFRLEFERDMLNPANFFDYLALFKRGEALSFQSSEMKKWNSSKKEAFFTGSTYGWQKNKEHDFSNMPPKVKGALLSYGYQV